MGWKEMIWKWHLCISGPGTVVKGKEVSYEVKVDYYLAIRILVWEWALILSLKYLYAVLLYTN